MSTENNTFTAWASTEKGKPLEEVILNLKQWDEDSVEMNVTHCGVCGSDIHTLEGDWGPIEYPCVPGHEIVGIISRIGTNVHNLKVGDRAGVGAQSGSCHQCEFCLNGQENMCQGHMTYTYQSNWPNGDRAFGGYADKWRGNYRFVFKIPESMSSEVAASFFCAGITAYSPLKCSNIIPNKSVVGVMGIGGLGHYGIQFAKAFGAKVIAISHNEVKQDIAFQVGCDEYLNCNDKNAFSKYQNQLTHILCTGTTSDFEWKKYLSLLKFNGYFLNLSIPRWKFPSIDTDDIFRRNIKISRSLLGSPKEIEEMLLFAVENNIVPWTTTYKMSDVNKALEDFKAGKPRFRFVLEN